MTTKGVIKNENGNVLIITLIILVALTFLGIISSRMSSIDLLVSGNKKIYTQNLYNAERAAYHAVQTLDSTNLTETTLNWVYLPLVNRTALEVVKDDATWENHTFPGGIDYETIPGLDEIKYIAWHFRDDEVGESLDMQKTKVRAFAVYGRSEMFKGKSMVELGFRKAY